MKAIKTSNNSLFLRSKDHGIDVWIKDDIVHVTTFIRSEQGGGETTVKLSRQEWNSFAGTSLRMARAE